MLSRDSNHWLFSVKTFLAGMLALLVSFWLDIPRPYWALATVYIASQPLAGATGSKAFFRAIGTFAGAAAAVALVPNLVDAPPLLVLAIAVWSGACLYLSLLDRTPRGYAYMLAGYTTAIVGFPSVDAPDAIFDVALSRTEEILIGIVSAALVSSLLFPRAVSPVVAERVRDWLRDAKTSCRDALRLEEQTTTEAHWLRLLADTAQIENLAGHLPFEAAGGRRAASLIECLLPRMLMILPQIDAIADRLRELARVGGASPQTVELAKRLNAALGQSEATSEAEFAALREDLDRRIGSPIGGASWRELTELNLILRLRDLCDLFADCHAFAAALADESCPLSLSFAYPIENRLEPARHYDHHTAALAAFTLASTIILCCAIWIVAEWRDGAAAVMMAAVAGALFATQDDPAPSVSTFARWSLAAVCLSGLYVFGTLPQAHNFETLAVALMPGFLLIGLLIAEPRTSMVGLPLGVLTPSAMALQGAYSADLDGFLNSGIAMVAGMGISAAVTAVIRTAGAQARVTRFSQANRRTLTRVVDAPGGADEVRTMGLMFDRLAQLAPVAHAAHRTMPEAMRQLRAGFNLLDMRRTHDAMPPYPRRAVDVLLARLQRDHRRNAPPSPDVLAALDRALRRLASSKSRDRTTLLALVGLRSCLFPKEPPPWLAVCGANA